jgi:hypothetical protein
MRAPLFTLVIIGLILASAKLGAGIRKPIDSMNGHEVITATGLHVALPSNLPNIPAGLVPEP